MIRARLSSLFQSCTPLSTPTNQQYHHGNLSGRKSSPFFVIVSRERRHTRIHTLKYNRHVSLQAAQSLREIHWVGEKKKKRREKRTERNGKNRETERTKAKERKGEKGREKERKKQKDAKIVKKVDEDKA